jgi:hypothetical protein
MASWKPGDPVVTADDVREHALWRHWRTLKLQRVRRGRRRRIDYYVAEPAATVIDGLRNGKRGRSGDASVILNRIVTEWAARAG